MKFLTDILKCVDWPKKNLHGWMILAILVLVVPNLQGQSRKELENRRKKLIKDINVTSSLLNKKVKTRAATLDRYVALKNQIQSREALLETLQQEVVLVEENIQRNTAVVTALNDDIKRLEEEYTLMVRKAHRLKLSNSRLLFLFSADSFNDAFRRWQYLKQYDGYRKKQATLIKGTQATLTDKVQQLEIQKEDKEILMASEQEQKVILEQEMIAKGTILKTLRNDEDRLRVQLANKRKKHKKLNSAIESSIRKEIIAQRKRARQPEALTAPKSTASNKRNAGTSSIAPARVPAAPPSPARTNSNRSSSLTSAFQNNRGRLSWPVSSGVITSYFGKQAHPTLKKIQITNNGIDIQTNENATVKAVFQGQVVTTQFIPGHNYMVILRHGNYFTVYSNLESVLIKPGQNIETQQALGTVAMERKSGKSEVHFEVWRDKVRLNPTDWVRR